MYDFVMFCFYCIFLFLFLFFFFFSSRRRHTRFDCDWSSDVCSSDLGSLHPSIPYSNASNNQQVTTYAKAFLKHLEIVFPGISPHWTGRANLSTPFLDPNLYCSYSYWKFGQYTKFSGYEKGRQLDLETG